MPKPLKSLLANSAEACWLLGEESRWKIVRALLSGGALAIRDFASIARKRRDTVSKHVHLLLARGLIRRSDKASSDGRVEYFELVPDWRAEGDPLMLDFGECQVRFGRREIPEPTPPPVERKPSALPKRI
jgi:hypothetical protein